MEKAGSTAHPRLAAVREPPRARRHPARRRTPPGGDAGTLPGPASAVWAPPAPAPKRQRPHASLSDRRLDRGGLCGFCDQELVKPATAPHNKENPISTE